MMPRGAPIATLALSTLVACTPTEFAWSDAEAPQLARYLASFRAAVGERFVAHASRDELLRRLQHERVLWLGDNHKSERLHALQGELLAQLQRRGVRMVFALEAIGEEDEAAVWRFLRGERSLEQLRTTLRRRWSGSWLDDPTLDPLHYGGLLAFAQQHDVPVAALEPVPRLPITERDAVIAAAVRRLAARWPGRLLVVHIGQAHLVGDGDLVARAGLDGFVLGATAPPHLAAAAPADRHPGQVWRSDGGLWWFGELLDAGDQEGDEVAAADRLATWPRMSNDATR